MLLLISDILLCFGALAASYWLRFHSPLRQVAPPPSTGLDFRDYLPFILTGTFILVGSYGFLKLYDPRLLLRPLRSAEIILRGTSLWFLIFVCISYVLKFEPSISRYFTGLAFVTTATIMAGWRYAFHRWLQRSHWRSRITQRLLFVGWSDEAAHLAQSITQDRRHAYHVCGVIATNESRPKGQAQSLGSLSELGGIIQEHLVDTAVLVDLELPRERVLEIAAVCERSYVEFKIIPSFFQIFLSGLQTQMIAGVPLLGIEALPLDNVLNRMTKRTLDIIGALIGLTLSAPIILLLAVIIRRESPGAALFRQIRLGRQGRPFSIYKLRSMKTEAEDGIGPQWAVANDPRRLKIGAFMRRWNLDELPQFWNVLRGDMSLVGPRPERPELIEQFEKAIKNYHSRHEIRPGMTGWAQINGLRGNTSLEERVRYDLHYIENWSLLFDLQIMLLTFIRRQNAY